MDNQNKNKKINLALKIILPILVVVVIVGIWFFKTHEKPQEPAASGSSVAASDQSKEIDNSSSSETITDESQEKIASNSTVVADAPQETTGASQEIAKASQETAKADFVLVVNKLDLEKLKSYGLPIIIDFGADECIPCKEMAPVLEKLNGEWQGKVIVKFVDVWKYPNEAVNFPLQVIPTQFFFDAQGKPFVPNDPEGMQMIMYSIKDTQEHAYTAHQGGLTEAQLRAIFEEMGIK